jgi:hypothetical protein
LAAQEPAGGEPPTVGVVEMKVAGERWVFDVVQGPPDQGFGTGATVTPRGEAVAVGVSLDGRHRGSDARVALSVGFWRDSGEHMCDPFANQLRFSSGDPRASGKRLRPGDRPSETCTPPPDGGPGGLSIHLNLAGASWDPETGVVRVAGSFSGPLGRGEEALRITEGRFEATVEPSPGG